MLFLNGHGSNQPFVDAAARLVGVDHPDVLAGSAFYLSGGKALERIEEIRDSDAGGMAHACELKTSICRRSTRTRWKWRRRSTSAASLRECSYMEWSDGPCA